MKEIDRLVVGLHCRIHQFVGQPRVEGELRLQQGAKLDPRRFPGNPALVEQLHTQVLNDVDKLELKLRREAGDKAGQIRTTDSAPVPSGYQDAVADYFRRLSSNAH